MSRYKKRHDTDWFSLKSSPGKHKFIGGSTNAEAYTFDLFASQRPTMSISEFKQWLLDNTYVRGSVIDILQKYIDEGSGDFCCGRLCMPRTIRSIGNPQEMFETFVKAEKERGMW